MPRCGRAAPTSRQSTGRCHADRGLRGQCNNASTTDLLPVLRPEPPSEAGTTGLAGARRPRGPYPYGHAITASDAGHGRSPRRPTSPSSSARAVWRRPERSSSPLSSWACSPAHSSPSAASSRPSSLTDSGLGYGPTRLLAGVAFSLGLILVVIAGAELFTGNNLIVMATASGQVRVADLLRNWAIVYLGNMVGAVSVAVMIAARRLVDAGRRRRRRHRAHRRGRQGEPAVRHGVLAWSVGQRAGLPRRLDRHRRALGDGQGDRDRAADRGLRRERVRALRRQHVRAVDRVPAEGQARLQWRRHRGPTPAGAIRNLVACTAGNIVGGALLVGVVYWFVYLRPADNEAG